MTSEQPTVQMTNEERIYIALRVGMLIVGVVLHSLRYVPEQMALQRQLSLWALVLMGIGTVVIAASALRGWRRVSLTMPWVMPLDLVSVAIYTWILAPADAFFGLYVLLVVLYAMTVSYRNAISATVAFSMAFILGHALSPPETPIGLGLVGLKTLSLVLVGFIVARAVERQRKEGRELATAIKDRDQVNEQLARRVGELQAVAQITEIIHSSLDFDQVGTLVLDVISKVIDLPALAIFVIDKEKSVTLFSASVGVPRDEGMRPAGETLDLREIEAHLSCQRVLERGSTMVLFCGSAEGMDQIGEDDRLVLYALASELAVAVENSRLYKLTMRLSVTDELTGLRNYRHLQQRLDEEVTRAKRYGKHVSLLMLDTDDFKSFNDRYGHLAGDRALAEFAGVLRTAVREVDVAVRYGGEEFAVVLPETDAAGAFVVAEKIREALADYRFSDAEGIRCCTLTVSIGMATCPTHAHDKETLLRQADNALYGAKNGGKNRVRAPQSSPEPDTLSGG